MAAALTNPALQAPGALAGGCRRPSAAPGLIITRQNSRRHAVRPAAALPPLVLADVFGGGDTVAQSLAGSLPGLSDLPPWALPLAGVGLGTGM